LYVIKMNMFIKVLSGIFRTFGASADTPSNIRLNSTVIVFTCCFALLSITAVVCLKCLKGYIPSTDVVLYLGGLLTSFLSIGIGAKLVQKNIEGKAPDNPNSETIKTS